MSEKFPPIVFPVGTAGPLTHDNLPDIKIYIVPVGPEFSEMALARNSDKQRNESKPTVNTYTADMDSDFWKFLGDPIRFDQDGRLIDGQHRAKAAIKSGTTQLMVVITGFDKTAMRHVDAGRKRSYADTLSMREIGNHVYVAALISAMWYWYRGSYGDKNVPRLRNVTYSDNRPSNAQLDQMYDLLLDKELDPVPSVREALRMKARIQSRCPITAISVMHMLLGHIDPFNRDEFFAHVIDMDTSKNTSSEYPPNLLRARMQRSAEGRPELLTRSQWIHMWVHAYNAWTQGKTMSVLRPPNIPVKPESWANPAGLEEVAGLGEIASGEVA